MVRLPRLKNINSTQNIIVIECCTHCETHSWNTRHDEVKYANYAVTIAAMIQARHP